MAVSSKVKKGGFMARLFGFSGDDVEPEERPMIDAETLIRLNELCDKHTFVNVEFTNAENQSYQSLIIKVDNKQQSLLIDELYPVDPSLVVSPGEAIQITTSGKGVPVKFASVIEAVEMFEGSPAYRVALPRKLSANQRREFFRIPIHQDMGLRFQVPVEGGSVRTCVLLNLSSNGVRFTIDKNITEQFRLDRMIRQARMTMPDGTVFYCDLEVRSYEYRKIPDRFTIIGARLVDVLKKDQKQLDNFLISKQREIRKGGGEN